MKKNWWNKRKSDEKRSSITDLASCIQESRLGFLYHYCKILDFFVLCQTQFTDNVSEEYRNLCVGGPGFRPNNITVILEGNFLNFL